jgi:predicted negative regulator of RcsB-dependent stress response
MISPKLKSKIPEGLVAHLREDLGSRRIAHGIERLAKLRPALAALDASQKDAAAMVGLLAQWVDVGFDRPQFIKNLLARFPQVSRASLPLCDYLHLRMAEGFVAMEDEDHEKAIRHFETVLSFEGEVPDRELLAIAHFWIARCQRNLGRYESALKNVAKGKEFALNLQLPKMAAIGQVLESWLLFQEGKAEEARRILGEAETALHDADDFVTRGNIQSAYGRIARRQGRYEQALQRFASSIEEYKKRNPQHRNLARALANIAFVKRLIAVRLGRKIDREVVRRLKTTGSAVRLVAPPKVRERAQLEKLRAESLAHLAQAEAIYARYNDHRGLGTVHVDRGLLYLDSGDLDSAAGEGAAAYRLGEEKKDIILEARARILQSRVENARFEEQVEEKSDLSQRAQAALDFAHEAVELAKHTQNRRLLARAHTAQGFVLANDFFGDPHAAGECCDRAAALLKPEGQDYVWEDLQSLRRKLLKTGSTDSVLRQWSQGIVGDKTFQQISEEFAGIVIPRVWRREGRKVSRVAERLSISPKKVRRILSSAGLMGPRA